jgi:hypothetical protein
MLRDDLLELVGRPIASAVSFPVAASDIRRWAIAVYYPDTPPAQYWEVPEDELVAPDEFNPFAWSMAPLYDVDAPERSVGVEPPSHTVLLNGGIEVDYTGAGIRPGDVVTATAVLATYTERTGSDGPMLFTTVESTWVNQRQEPLCTHRMTTIRR